MSLPLFFTKTLSATGTMLDLDEATSRHIGQVLRMKHGDKLCVTNGKGKKLTVSINTLTKKGCTVYIEDEIEVMPLQPRISIAISLLKNASRFEWFLEKVTEMGVSSIIPLICERTEKTHFRADRMNNILVSAMLQSQQCWLPELHPPCGFATCMETMEADHKFIAHCLDTGKPGLAGMSGKRGTQLICIGPEGDFTPAEIDRALQEGFIPVGLGDTRLRTETAGIAAAVLLRIH